MLFDMLDSANEAFSDVIYLDILMPEMPGDEVAQKLRALNVESEIVFLTNSKDHMLKGYDVRAFHYIVKKETPQKKFEEIFLQVIERAKKKKQKLITFSCAGENRTIGVEQIKYFIVTDKIVTVYYEDNQSFEFYTTLNKLENTFLGNGFVRIHRSHLVSLKHIKRNTGPQVEMTDGKRLSVGKKYKALLREEIENTTTI